MTEWQTKTVGKLADTQLGKMLNKGKQSGKFAKPYLRTDNVHWGRFDLSEIKEMDIFPEEEEKYLATKGDLLMCEGGASGRTAIWNEEYNISFQNHVHRIRPKNYGEIAPKYLLYYFEWFIKNGFASDLIKGVTISSLSQSALRSIEVTYPPIDEQHKIVELLEDHLLRLDAALADVQQAKLKAAQFRRSLFYSVFNGLIGEFGKKVEWGNYFLGDIVENLDNRRIPVNSSERSLRLGKVPYYGATGQVGTIDKPIFDDELLLLGEDGVQFFDPDKSKAYLIAGPSWVNNHAHVLRANDSIVNQKLLMHYLNQFNYVGYANGTTRLKLTQGSMNTIPVSLPSRPMQEQMIDFIDQQFSIMDASVKAAEIVAIQSVSLRRSLLQSAFTGQLSKEILSV